MRLPVKKLHPDAILPTYATDGSACVDLYSRSSAALFGARHTVNLGTGLAFDIPEGHGLLIFSRSGQGFNHDTRLSNCVGIIDSDYRGEVRVKLIRDVGDELRPLQINKGDRIAQAMLVPIPRMEIVEVDALSETVRGVGGFGSTGV